MRRSEPVRALSLAAGAAAVALLAGCSTATPVSTPTGVDLSKVEISDPARNGIEYLPGADAFDRVVTASRKAGWVTMTGSFLEHVPEPKEGEKKRKARSIAIDFSGRDSAYTATVSADTASFDMVVAEDHAYVRGNAEFAAATGVIAATGGFACLSPEDPALDRFELLTDPVDLLGALLDFPADGDLSVSTGTVTGEPPTAALIVGDGSSVLGTLTVAATDEPLPLSFVASDASGEGTFTFSNWGVKQTIAAPAEIASPCA
jgi:hypothetical protein